jgi:CRISPR-associated protein (TIGR02584 family)
MSQKHVLLSVTGMSPQVVTETLYAIHRDNRPWPEEIQVITTARGAQQVQEGLLARGNLQQLCEDYSRPVPEFGPDQILVVPDAAGAPVDDARTLSDHEALADFITRTVFNLTRQAPPGEAEICLHASLAGGRKTMTFYLGYAMSLFARPDDCLSHVLVDAQYEGQPDFYYPTPGPREFKTRNGEVLDAAEAEVTLADIPFIRHRDYLPGRFHHLHDGISFRALIDLINLGQVPDRVQVTLNDERQTLVVARGDGKTVADVPMTPANYIAYRMVIRLNQLDQDLVRLPSAQIPDTDMAWSYMEDAFVVAGLPFDENATLTQLIDLLADRNELHPTGIANRTLDSLRIGMRRSFFSERMNEIRSTLHDYLPEKLQKLLEVRPLFLNRRKATQAELDKDGTHTIKGGAYSTMLSAEQFHLQTATEAAGRS